MSEHLPGYSKPYREEPFDPEASKPTISDGLDMLGDEGFGLPLPYIRKLDVAPYPPLRSSLPPIDYELLKPEWRKIDPPSLDYLAGKVQLDLRGTGTPFEQPPVLRHPEALQPEPGAYELPAIEPRQEGEQV